MTVEKPAPYRDSGELLERLRSAVGFFKQQDLATALDVKQQTVSRWERGLSRPRERDIPGLARVLKVEQGILLAAAGYGERNRADVITATSFDRPLPLHALTPEGFERFCYFLLERLYRGTGHVHRYGENGHKQDGIDIYVTGSFGTHTFQCKRVERFGAQKVHAAVATQVYEADRKVLALSSTASPDARDAIEQHPGWEIWDREDLSQKLRSLSVAEQIELVDIFFRGHRFDLLGVQEAGPFLRGTEFFKPFLKEDRLFSHQWPLVGRIDAVQRVAQSVFDEKTLTLLVGGPGYGKSRLLREIVRLIEIHDAKRQIFFVSPTEELKAAYFEQLGRGPLLLIVDDAHDRRDLGALLMFAAKEDNVRLLFSLRPYGEETLRHQAAQFNLSGPHVQIERLEALSKVEAQQLATIVLRECKGSEAAAEAIADVTYGSPIATVLGAQIVARGNVAPALLGNAEEFQDQVLARLRDVIAGSIASGQDADRLQRILRVVSVVQPVMPDDPALLDILNKAEGIDAPDAVRLLRLLIDSGVLFKRGRWYRIAPDLLAEAVIQQHYVTPGGVANDRAIQVFELASPEHLKNLLVNLGRLEWRLNEGDTEGGKVLESIAPQLRWFEGYSNPHIDAAKAVAYYQPRIAIDFARRLIRDGHGDHDAVARLLRNAAFTLKYLEEVCELLWVLGRSDQEQLNQDPAHGIRLLQELAEFEPNKPIECVRAVVRFALELLHRPKNLDFAHTPFEILTGALKPEMEVVKWTSKQMTITRFGVPLAQVKDVRDQVTDGLLNCIAGGPSRKAFLAVQTISEALRGPMNGIDKEEWDRAHAEVLVKLHSALIQNDVSPVVLVRAAMAVRWHAHYGSGASQTAAAAIASLLDKDLSTRVTRALMDGWGRETYNLLAETRGQESEMHRAALVRELLQVKGSPESVSSFLGQLVGDIDTVAGRNYGASFIFISRLIGEVSGLPEAILAMHKEDKTAAMAAYAGAALGVILSRNSSGDRLANLLGSDDSEDSLALVAEAYARHQPSEGYSSADIGILQCVFSSQSPSVLRYVGDITLLVAKANPALALDLILRIDLLTAGQYSHDVFMWLSHAETIPKAMIRPEHRKLLLQKLLGLARLDDHWIQTFLCQSMKEVPDECLDFLIARAERAIETRDWSYRVVESRYMAGVDESADSLGFCQQSGWEERLQRLLEWALANDDSVAEHALGGIVLSFCGPLESSLLYALLEWMKLGSSRHAEVVGAILRSAQSTLIYDHPDFVSQALDVADFIGEEAVSTIQSALWSVTTSGGRRTSPGVPFREDIRLKDYATEKLAQLSRADPSHELFSVLLREAERGIERQLKDGKMLDADDDV